MNTSRFMRRPILRHCLAKWMRTPPASSGADKPQANTQIPIGKQSSLPYWKTAEGCRCGRVFKELLFCLRYRGSQTGDDTFTALPVRRAILLLRPCRRLTVPSDGW
jgi:hypothetical protein